MTAPVILVEAQPWRAADGVAETVRLAGGGADKPYRYFGQAWRAGIVRLPTWIAALQVEEGEIGLGGVPNAAEIAWAPASSADLAALAGYFWTNAPITVRIGPEGADPPIEHSGKVLTATVEDGVLELALADPAADLKKPFPVGRFLGTGGVEGPAEWEGLMRRRLWGRLWNVRGDPIDKANNVYCFGDPQRSISAFDAVRDKGAAAVSLTTLAWQGSVAATFAALQAAAAPAGGAVICPSIACLKWWTQPAGDLTADLKGETAGGYVETTADIAAKLVAAASGPGFASGTVAAAASARPAPAGWIVADDSTTSAAMLDQLLGASSLLWAINSAGAIVLRQWAWGSSVATAASLEVARKRSFRPLASRKLGYRRNELPMARGDLAAIVFDAAYSDGTPIDNLKPAEPGSTKNTYFIQGTDPGGSNGSLWKDTSTTPAKFKLKVAGAWVDVSSLVTDTAQIADGAQLGLTAVWASVSGSGKPENDATKNTYFVGTSDPGGSNGSLWKDTSTTPAKFKLKVAGAWVDVSSLVTDTAQIADGAQLGLTALWSGVTGGGKPSDNAGTTLQIYDPNTTLFTIRGNTVTKATASAGFTRNAYSYEFFKGMAAISFRLDTTGPTCGFTDGRENPAGFTDYDKIDYGVSRNADGHWYALESGSAIDLGTGFGATTAWLIAYDGSTVKYFADGVQQRSVSTTSGRTFYAAVSAAAVGETVSNIIFGSGTENVWSSLGGVPAELTDGRISAGLNASGQVQSNKVIQTSITSNSVSNITVTTLASDGNVDDNDTWTNVMSASVTTDTSGTVLISVCAKVEQGAAGSFSTKTKFDVRIRRGASTILQTFNGTIGYDEVLINLTASDTLNGTDTYYFDIRVASTWANAVPRSGSVMSATALKK